MLVRRQMVVSIEGFLTLVLVFSGVEMQSPGISALGNRPELLATAD